MRDIYLANYLPGDETAFKPRPDMAEDMAATGWDWSEGPPGPTWALMRWDGEILGIGGFFLYVGEKYEAWSVLAPLRRRDWPQVLELARLRLEGQFRLGVLRVHAACRADNPGALRCLRRLGFDGSDTRVDARLPGVLITEMQRLA